MANLKDIKSRIQSVENTKKITRAMKMVAAAKVKKAETSVKAGRPFSEELISAFKKLLASVGTLIDADSNFALPINNYPALLKRRDIKTSGLLVITSNKGLAGAYNANIIRGALKKIKDNNDKGIKSYIFIIGQKGIASLKRKAEEFDFEIVKSYTKIASEISASGATAIAEDLAEYFVSEKIDSIEIFTTKFKNMMSYAAENWELLPVNTEEISSSTDSASIDPLMVFEPAQSKILQSVVPMYISNTIYQALLEAQASELASRMTAMSAASTNAEDMIRVLTIDYNKARQWAITQEILEVVSGADALKG